MPFWNSRTTKYETKPLLPNPSCPVPGSKQKPLDLSTASVRNQIASELVKKFLDTTKGDKNVGDVYFMNMIQRQIDDLILNSGIKPKDSSVKKLVETALKEKNRVIGEQKERIITQTLTFYERRLNDMYKSYLQDYQSKDIGRAHFYAYLRTMGVLSKEVVDKKVDETVKKLYNSDTDPQIFFVKESFRHKNEVNMEKSVIQQYIGDLPEYRGFEHLFPDLEQEVKARIPKIYRSLNG